MRMPLVDGLAATRAICNRERPLSHPPTPIAVFTANAMDEHRALAIADVPNITVSDDPT